MGSLPGSSSSETAAAGIPHPVSAPYEHSPAIASSFLPYIIYKSYGFILQNTKLRIISEKSYKIGSAYRMSLSLNMLSLPRAPQSAARKLGNTLKFSELWIYGSGN